MLALPSARHCGLGLALECTYQNTLGGPEAHEYVGVEVQDGSLVQDGSCHPGPRLGFHDYMDVHLSRGM
jgi:hypothetical protein